ncbi:MAG: class I SAM-dependent methyltransferase [Acidobacteriota bacterium]
MLRNVSKQILGKLGYELVRTKRRTYGGEWDSYVRAAREKIKNEGVPGDHTVWPGDEWADAANWERIFQTLLADKLPRASTRFVELGQGSGKYTEKVVRHFSGANVLCADVSESFLAVLAERLHEEIAAGRVSALLIDQRNHRQLLQAIEARGWVGKLDALYSIDAMVHVDLQIQFAYWLTAAQALRPGGLLALTLADPTTDEGFGKLVADVALYYSKQGIPSHKFEWLGPDMVTALLTRLGFGEIEITRVRPRDIYVTARLQRPYVGAW